MSSSNCCFLTHIQVTQETGKVVGYSHLFKNFPQLVVIHAVKGFGIVNKAEEDAFLELSCFLTIQRMLAIWSLVLLPFLNPAWTSGSSQFTYSWSLVWRILSIALLAWRRVQFCGSLSILWHCLSLGLEWKMTFSSPVVTVEFSKFAGIFECSTFTPSSFRIWNSSTGIPSPPLALFVVMLSKAHLTSHSRMSGSRWVITSSWLSGSWRSFLYSDDEDLLCILATVVNIFCFC